MVEKKSLNVKIPMDLYEKIEGSGRTQVAIIEEALRKYFDSEKVVDTTKQVSIGRAYNETRWFQEEIRRVNDRILALAPSPEEITKKNWWQFWK